MADGIVLFTPKAELDAEGNLAAFIDVCRKQLTVFGADLPFGDMQWDVTVACARKGHGTKRERVTFCTMDTAGKRSSLKPLPPRFGDFAKACIRYMQGLNPVVGLGPRMGALRALEAALAEHGDDLSPVKVDSGILNRAAQLIRANIKGAAYGYGGQLQAFADMMDELRLATVPLRWKSPIPRPTGGTRVGPEFDKRREEKLPSQAALDALPKVFRCATEPADVLISSVAALLCSAPDRINESLLLPLDCEVRLPRPKSADEAYGLRWWPAKGADPMVKLIVPTMTGVVKEALERIRRCTASTREVAKWYEKNPRSIWLPKPLKRLQKAEFLSMHEIADILWGHHDVRGAGRQWCTNNEVPMVMKDHRIFARFSDVEAAVLRQLPAGFPYLDKERGLKYSEALLVVPLNFFHGEKATYVPLFEPVVIQHINDGLGARTEHGSTSIFETYGFAEDDGSPIRVLTHQFRHYLNTLADIGGLSQLDIAKWSGRKDIRQNEAYNHVSAHEIVASIRKAFGEDESESGPLAAMPKNVPITRDEFAQLKILTAHITDLGFCVHNFAMAPCQIHRDCINCDEHVCVKGDEAKLAHLLQQLDMVHQLLRAAEDASCGGSSGSDRWAEHQRVTVARLEQLCDIMRNPAVPVGAVIRLSHVRPASRLQQAEDERQQGNVPAVSAPAEAAPPMNRIRDLLAD